MTTPDLLPEAAKAINQLLGYDYNNPMGLEILKRAEKHIRADQHEVRGYNLAIEALVDIMENSEDERSRKTARQAYARLEVLRLSQMDKGEG